MSINQQVLILGVMVLTILGTLFFYYLIWGIYIKHKTQQGAVSCKTWDIEHTNLVKTHIVTPNSSGKAYVNGFGYHINTRVTNQDEMWPAGAPSILQVKLPVSLHIEGAEPAIGSTAEEIAKGIESVHPEWDRKKVMSLALQYKIPDLDLILRHNGQANDTEADIKTLELVIRVVNDALTKFKERFFTITNILILAGILAVIGMGIWNQQTTAKADYHLQIIAQQSGIDLYATPTPKPTLPPKK